MYSLSWKTRFEATAHQRNNRPVRHSQKPLAQVIPCKSDGHALIMTTIHKKVWSEYFEKIISGKKKLELRLADFEIREGDTLVLEEWDKDKKEYTGRRIEVVVTYILKTKGQTFWSEKDVEQYGFQIIQFEPKLL